MAQTKNSSPSVGGGNAAPPAIGVSNATALAPGRAHFVPIGSQDESGKTEGSRAGNKLAEKQEGVE